MVVPARLRPPGDNASRPHPARPDAKRRTCRSATRRSRWPTAAGFAAAVLVIMFSEQAFLNAGPLIVRGLAGRRRGRLHLQRADDRAGAAAALPGGLDQHPPPPDQPPHQRASPTASASSTARCGWCCSAIAAFTAFTALVVLIAGPQLMQLAFSDKFSYDRAGLLLVTARHGPLPLPRSPSTRPASPRARCAAPRPAGSPAPRSSSAGTSCRWSATSSAGSRSASRSPPACSSACST